MDWSFYAKTAGAMLLCIAVLYACNEPHARRYRQRWLPVFAFCMGAVVLFIEWRYYPRLTPIINGITSFLDGLESFIAWLDNVTQGKFSGILSGVNFSSAKDWVGKNPVLICNVLILAAMIPVKMAGLQGGKVAGVWRAVLRFVSRKRLGKEPQPAKAQLAPAYQYRTRRGSESAADNVFLLPAWVYPQRYLFHLAWLAVFAVLCGLAGLAWDAHVQALAPAGATPPAIMEQFLLFRLPAIPLLIILESLWYLGGMRPDEEAPQQMVTEKPVVKNDLDRLWAFYERVCPERRLAGNPAVQYPPAKEQNPAVQYPPAEEQKSAKADTPLATIVRNNLKENNLPALDATQIDALSYALSEKGQKSALRLVEPVFDQVAPVVFARLQHEYLNGGHILVLLPADADIGSPGREAARVWLQRGFASLYLSRITPEIGEGARPQAPVHLATLSEFMAAEAALRQDWLQKLGLVPVIDADRFFFANIFQAGVLCDLLHDTCPTPPGYLLLATEDRQADEATLSEVLGRKGKEEYKEFKGFGGSGLGGERHCFHVWRAESKSPQWDCSFQEVLLHEQTSAALTELPLAEPAFREGFESVTFLGSRAVCPVWREGLEEMRELITYSLEGKLGDIVDGAGKRAGDPRRLVCFPALFARQEQQRVAVGYDTRNNICEVVRAGLRGGREATLFLGVAPLYMLRDYFCDFLAHFLANPGTLSGFLTSPRRAPNRATIAHLLAFRLQHGAVDGAALEPYLEKAGYDVKNEGVLSCLVKLFDDVFNKDIKNLNLLATERKYRYVMARKEFEETTLYRLLPSSAKHIDTGRSMCRYTVRVEVQQGGAGGKVLGDIPGDRVYQNFLPGQVHGWDTDSYIVQAIDDEKKIVTVVQHTVQARKARKTYRHLCSAKVTQLYQAPNTQSEPVSDGRVGRMYTTWNELLEADMAVTTRGYYDVTEDWAAVKHVPYKHTRRYSRGRLLLLSIQAQDGADASALSWSLALLLSEMIPTLFPDTWRSLLVTSPVAPSSWEKIKPSLWTKRHHQFGLLPRLYGKGLKGLRGFVPSRIDLKKACTVVFVEDAEFDLGMMEAIRQDWKTRILPLLYAYLQWVLKGGDNPDEERAQFLRFGGENLHEDLQLAKLRDFLAGLNLATSSLPESVEKKVWGKHLCDFCGRETPADELERLEDGRERCSVCTATAVKGKSKDDKAAKERQLYQQAREFMIDAFGIQLREDITVSFLSAQELAVAKGEKAWRPTPGFDHRSTGFAMKMGDGASAPHEIYIEDEQPEHMALAIIVHELTHIWQFDNLDLKKAGDMNGLLEEGHAVWAEVAILEHLNTPQAREYIASEKERQDIYGQGYREIVRLLEQFGMNNPFELLALQFAKDAA